MVTSDIARLSNEALITETTRAAGGERAATVRLVTLLAELDARRLYLDQGFPSLFAYCTDVLHLSEHSAYHRIEAARAAQDYPLILERLTDGSLTLTAVGLLRAHLTKQNHVAVLDAARHRSKRDIERLVAELAPKRDAAPMVRRLPAVRPLRVAAAAAPAERRAPSLLTQVDATPPKSSAEPADSRDRYLVRLTISGRTHAKLMRARDLLGHSVPNGDPAEIIDRALTVLVQNLERTKLAATARPRPARSAVGKGRHIPAAVRRAVWRRDEGRCTFAGVAGRCGEKRRLEFHHVVPYARSGPTDAANLTLRCRAHNAHDARLAFGDGEPWRDHNSRGRGSNSVRTESAQQHS